MSKMSRAEFETEILQRLLVEHIRINGGRHGTVESEFLNPDGLIQGWQHLASLAGAILYGEPLPPRKWK